MDRSTYPYRSRRPDQAPLRARIQEICADRVRCGYRRVHVPLRREGRPLNHERSYGLYEELGQRPRKLTPKRRVTAKLREDRSPAAKPYDVWAMDLAHDRPATGQRMQVLSVVDTFSPFSSALDAREKSEAWRIYHNDARPHGAIGQKTPSSLQNPGGASRSPP